MIFLFNIILSCVFRGCNISQLRKSNFLPLYKDVIDEKLVYKKKEELLDPLFIKTSELLVDNILEDGENVDKE